MFIVLYCISNIALINLHSEFTCMHCNKWDSHSPSVYSSVRVVRMPPVTVINLPNSGRGWAAKVSRITVPLKTLGRSSFVRTWGLCGGVGKTFWLGGGTVWNYTKCHGVVSNLYNNLWNLRGHMPPVPTRFLRLCCARVSVEENDWLITSCFWDAKTSLARSY